MPPTDLPVSRIAGKGEPGQPGAAAILDPGAVFTLDPESIQHVVQFYEDDARLAVVVAEFLASGMAAGEPLVVIATPEHWRAFRRGLEERGFDVAVATSRGQITLLDAAETLSQLMEGPTPDWERFREVVDGVLRRAASAGGGRRVRAYGEMVDLLWRQGDARTALRLEEMWNQLQVAHGFSLLCAYVMGNFYTQAADLQHVCASHTHVLRTTGGRNADSDPTVVPPQHARALAAEVAHRQELEKALRATVNELRLKEAELSQSQHHLQDFVENAALPLHWVGADGTIQWANRADLELLGYPHAEYVGRPFADFHVDREVAQAILACWRRNEEVHNREVRLRAADGSVKHVLLSSNIYWRQGRFGHTRCFLRDITAQKQLERSRAGGAERTERLMKITAAIADAVTPEQVHFALVNQSADALGASSAGLWLVEQDPRTATLVQSVGYLEASRLKLQTMPLGAEGRLPVIDSIRLREPIWISSQEELLARYPHLAPLVTPGRSYRISCLPVVVRGRAIGGLAFTFDDAPAIDQEQRDLMLLVARYSGQALERLRLLEMERRSRAQVEAGAGRLELLSRASRAFTEAGHELPQLLSTVAEQVTVELADACGILLVSERGDTLQIAAVHHRDPTAASMVRSLMEMSPMKVGEGMSGQVAATGRSIFVPTVDTHTMLTAAYQPYRAFVERYMPHSIISVPLRVQGRTVGVLNAMRQRGSSSFLEEDRCLLEELAERAAVAIESSRLYVDSQQGRLRAELLYGLARSVIEAKQVEEVFDPALDAIERALGTARCSILLVDGDGVMRFRAWRGLSDEYRASVDGHSPWARGALNPRSIFVSDVETDPAMAGYLPVFRREKIGALAFVPLLAAGRLIGKFMVYYDRPREFVASQLDMAGAIADHVAAACARFASVAQLEQTVRFNEMFAGILGHDLRNPLGAIMASAELALRRDEGGKIAKPVSRILSSGHRMARMIDQLLDFTRVRVGAGIPLESSNGDLFQVLRQTTDELEQAHPHSLRLALTGQGEGTFDLDRMSQVFSNLIGNAIQHGLPEQGVEIRADGTSPDRIRVEVHNAGVIAAPLLGKLFEPMTGGERRRDGSQGLGLGLYIGKQIVEAHGGQIEVRSSETTGTTFVTTIPRTDAARRAPP